MMMEGIFLLLGSNLGDRLSNITAACHKINLQIGTIKNHSGIYETDPWGKTDQSSFYNKVLEIVTTSTPAHLLEQILTIENEIGRKRIEKWGARIIDIDILYYNDIILTEKKLSIPHPELQNRLFTLIPLCEIAPNLIHPIFKITQQQLLEQCDDQLKVTKLDASNF